MGISGLLDIAISLVCMYLVLSLICTTINEFIATFFKLRAKWLASAIQALIDNPDLRSAFHKHGLIANAISASKGRDIVDRTEENAETASYLDSRTFAMALLGSLDPSKPTPVIADIQELVNKLPPGKIKDVLGAQLATAAGNIDILRSNIAEWFDSAMDRLSGSYKRWLKWISLSVGIVLAAALNADSFAVGTAGNSSGTNCQHGGGHGEGRFAQFDPMCH